MNSPGVVTTRTLISAPSPTVPVKPSVTAFTSVVEVARVSVAMKVS